MRTDENRGARIRRSELFRTTNSEDGARCPLLYSRIENARSFAIREQDRLTMPGADRDLFSNVETNEKVGRC